MKPSMLILLAFFTQAALQAQTATGRQQHFNLEKKVALAGYDPVSYFNQNPQKGNSGIRTTQEGVIYYFASASNKETFLKNPAQYEPQYGGWCAYAMGATGDKVEVDPKTYKILDGKLYLFYNKYFNNTLKSWNQDEPALRQKADKNWKSLVGR